MRNASYDRSNVLPRQRHSSPSHLGNEPGQVLSIDACVPDSRRFEPTRPSKRRRLSLQYMDLTSATPRSTEIGINRVFIGSCTNARIEDLRAAPRGEWPIAVATSHAMVVPGSGQVKKQARTGRPHKIFIEGRMELGGKPDAKQCFGDEPDKTRPSGERCASTSNRQLEGRQWPNGGRTHLVQPRDGRRRRRPSRHFVPTSAIGIPNILAGYRFSMSRGRLAPVFHTGNRG